MGEGEQGTWKPWQRCDSDVIACCRFFLTMIVAFFSMIVLFLRNFCLSVKT